MRILKKLRGAFAGARQRALVVALGALTAACASATRGGARPAPFPTVPAAVTSPAAPDAPTASRAAAVVETARALRGTPYRLGGADPTGFDCSGLVRYVFLQHAIDLPRTTAEQARVGRRVDLTRVAAGDLVFFSTTGPGSTHVGIMLDHETFIHAPDTGSVVRIERLDAPYWRRRLVSVKRVAG